MVSNESCLCHEPAIVGTETKKGKNKGILSKLYKFRFNINRLELSKNANFYLYKLVDISHRMFRTEFSALRQAARIPVQVLEMG